MVTPTIRRRARRVNPAPVPERADRITVAVFQQS